MKCRVCSQETPGPAKLCAKCGAAMKRAREVPTPGTEPVASSKIPGLWTLMQRRQRAALWIGAGVVVTATAAVYLGQRERNDLPLVVTPAATLTQSAMQPQVPTAPVAAPASEPVVLQQAEPSKSMRAGTTAAAAPIVRDAMEATPLPAKPVQKLALQQTETKAPAPSASDGPTKPDAGSGLAMKTTETASSRVATAALPKAADPQDRVQALTDALGRCGAEGSFSRVACEERARLQYCDGAWGSITQCPVVRRNENRP